MNILTWYENNIDSIQFFFGLKSRFTLLQNEVIILEYK